MLRSFSLLSIWRGPLPFSLDVFSHHPWELYVSSKSTTKPCEGKVLVWVQSAKIITVQTPGVSRKEDEQRAAWQTSHITGRAAKPYKNRLQILFRQITSKTHKVTLPFYHEPPMRLTYGTWSVYVRKNDSFIHKIITTLLWPEVIHESFTFSYILSLPFLIFY